MRISLHSLTSELLQSHQTLSRTKLLHAVVTGLGLSADPFYATRILRFYAFSGDTVSARQVFDQTPLRSVFLWNSIIRAFARDHQFGYAFALFNRMLGSSAAPDEFTFACILQACAEKSDPSGVRWAHGLMVVSGLWPNSIAGTALMDAYLTLGFVVDAEFAFAGITKPDLVTWNSLLFGYGQNGYWIKGIELFNRMQRLGVKPDEYTMVALLSCLYRAHLLGIGKGVHGLCLKHGLGTCGHVGSALVSMYSRCSGLISAHQLFREFHDPDLIMWSSLVAGFSLSGESGYALFFFAEMMKAAKIPDPVLIATVLAACARSGIVRIGKEIHAYAFRVGVESDLMVASALVEVYSKSGFIGIALWVFEKTTQRNSVTYNSIILGLGLHGLAQKAFDMFREMLEKGLKPDKSTFSALLCACCHGGRLAEARNLLRRMENEFSIIPDTEHYVYMVKLLGAVGELEEAYHLILNMPVRPDSGVWGALLWACSMHGNPELSKVVAHHLCEMEPDKTAYRVMLSNICAADGRWHDVGSLRDELMEGRSRKIPGCSWLL